MTTEKELEQVANGYREDGYDVVARPTPEQLPPFAAGFRIDLLAKKGGDGVLVRVMETRQDVARGPDLTRLAEVVEPQKGWRFDLVVLEPEDPLARAGEPEPEEIERWLDEAEQVGRMGATRAAYVVAWSALEAAMRRTARAAGLAGNGHASSRVVLSGLYSNGFLAPAEFKRLGQASQVRAEFAHGFLPAAYDERLLSDVVAAARRLLAESPRDGAAAG